MFSEGMSTRKLPTLTKKEQTGQEETEEVEIGRGGGARDLMLVFLLLTFGGPVFQKEHWIAVK